MGTIRIAMLARTVHIFRPLSRTGHLEAATVKRAISCMIAYGHTCRKKSPVNPSSNAKPYPSLHSLLVHFLHHSLASYTCFCAWITRYGFIDYILYGFPLQLSLASDSSSIPNVPAHCSLIARPCQRCVKRGMADNCMEGHRKKAKYLLDEEELGPHFH